MNNIEIDISPVEDYSVILSKAGLTNSDEEKWTKAAEVKQ